MTIICGTDFSTNAAEAEVAAAALAKHLGTDLKLVHVIDVRRQPLSASALALVFEPVEDLLNERAKRLEQDYGIAASAVLLQGAADECLNTLARESEARLVIVSSIGAREQASWRLGSVAERVAQRSAIPVLVVRDSKRILAWLQRKTKLKVMVGVDMGAASRAALTWAQEFTKIAPCDLTVAQVIWPPLEHSRLGVDRPLLLEGIRTELKELLERDLRAWVGPVVGAGETSFLISPGWGRSDTHLTNLAEKASIDLLVVGTHQKSWAARAWQGSVSRRVIHDAASNVACIPRTADDVASSDIVQYRRVLIPTDFSTLAARAISAGYGMLRPGGEAHLVYVQLVTDEEHETNDLEQRLRALIPEEAAALGIASKVHVVVDGEPAAGIARLAARLAADAICMSTHGRTGAAELLLGSQAREVVRIAEQPVLLIKAARD